MSALASASGCWPALSGSSTVACLLLVCSSCTCAPATMHDMRQHHDDDDHMLQFMLCIALIDTRAAQTTQQNMNKGNASLKRSENVERARQCAAIYGHLYKYHANMQQFQWKVCAAIMSSINHSSSCC